MIQLCFILFILLFCYCYLDTLYTIDYQGNDFNTQLQIIDQGISTALHIEW